MTTLTFLLYAFICVFFTFELAKADGKEIFIANKFRNRPRRKGVINHPLRSAVWLFMVLSPWLLFAWQAGLALGVRFLFIALAVRAILYGPVVHYFAGLPLFYVGTTAKYDRFLRWSGIPSYIAGLVIALICLTIAKYLGNYLVSAGIGW